MSKLAERLRGDWRETDRYALYAVANEAADVLDFCEREFRIIANMLDESFPPKSAKRIIGDKAREALAKLEGAK